MKASEEPVGEPPEQMVWLGLLVAVGLLLYPNVFLLRGTPLLLGGDQVFFWTFAQRMLHGERPYVDFFQFTPPGTDLLYLALFRLFGARIMVTVAVDFALGLALASACFMTARRIMRLRSAAVTALAFVAAIYVPLVNGTHHVFSLLVIMLALVTLMRWPTGRGRMLAGGIFALASFFTHTHGAIALFAALAWGLWEGRSRDLAWRRVLLVAGLELVTYLAVLALLYSYFLVTVGATRLWECEVAFVSKYMLAQPTSVPGLPEPITWERFERFVLSCALPVVYPVALLVTGKTRPRTDVESHATLLAMVGLALCLEVAVSPSWLRYYAVAMPAVILLGWLADRCGRWRAIPLTAGLATALYVGAAHTRDRQRAPYIVRDLPAGTAAVPIESDEKLEFVMTRTEPGDFFLQAIWPGLYFPLGLRDPLSIDTLGADDLTRPEWVSAAISTLDERRVRYVLWAPVLNRPEPGNERAYHLGPMVTYLHARYRRVKALEDGEEIWERRGL